jgi:hypothetical protein
VYPVLDFVDFERRGTVCILRDFGLRCATTAHKAPSGIVSPK